MARVGSIGVVARGALPFYAKGKVVSGFGRGSKELGIPTANFPDEVVENLPVALTCGVYCGFSRVDDGPVYRMVLSIGWNPFYKNTKRTMETHVLHEFGQDFYGSELKIIITDFIRPMLDFTSLDALKTAINQDIEDSKTCLSSPEHAKYEKDDFLQTGKLPTFNDTQ